LGDENILMVLNTHYGDRRFLPFDLSHKAGPIMFDLPPDARRERILSEKKSLVQQFVVALRPYLAASAKSVAPTFVERPSTASAATFFELGEQLGVIGEREDKFDASISRAEGFYLRVIPSVAPTRPLIRVELVGALSRAGMFALWRKPSRIFRANRYGAAVLEPIGPLSGVRALTEVFENGEVWGFAPWLLISNEHGRYVPAKAFEETYRLLLPKYVAFIRDQLGLSVPYTIEAGAVGLQELRLIIGNGPDDRYGPFYGNEFKVRRILNADDGEALNGLLLEIFKELFRHAGYHRPANLYGFG
jgi:hypothetical protein